MELYEWQKQVLSQSLTTRTIVFTVPTSGGKSLVADLIALREFSLTGRKCLALFPQISICEEKLSGYRKKFQSEGCMALNIGALYGDSKTWTSKYDVSICTAEKANNLLNRILLENPITAWLSNELNQNSSFIATMKASMKEFAANTHPIEQLGTIIIDEAHELSDPNRWAIVPPR